MINPISTSRRRQRAEPSDSGMSFRSGIERLFEQFFDPVSSGGGSLTSSMVVPAMEIVERDNETHVTAELPGMNPDDIDVTVNGNQLVISGEKRDENQERRAGYYRSERRYGMFRRVIELPHDIEPNDVNVEFENGVLKLTVPHSEAQQPRRIPIRSGGGQQSQPQSGRQSQARSEEPAHGVGGRFQSQGDGSKTGQSRSGQGSGQSGTQR